MVTPHVSPLPAQSRTGHRCGCAAGLIVEQIRLDETLHQTIYALSGNPMTGTMSESDWQFPRRATGDVLKQLNPPREIAHQRATILEVNVTGLLAKMFHDGVEEQERELAAIEQNMVGGPRRIR